MARAMLQSRPMRRRGFTLVELMIVVAIVGILAALAIYGVRKYQLSAGTGEATATLQSIRGAEEAFRSETLVYGGCKNASAAPQLTAALVTDDFYPRNLASLNGQKLQWGGAVGSLLGCTRALGIQSGGAVRFTYGVMAGTPDAPPVAVTPTVPAGTLLTFTPREPWYTAVAYGDRDDDNDYARLVTYSFSNDVSIDNDTE